MKTISDYIKEFNNLEEEFKIKEICGDDYSKQKERERFLRTALTEMVDSCPSDKKEFNKHHDSSCDCYDCISNSSYNKKCGEVEAWKLSAKK